MQEVAGTEASKWCAGGHDHAVLFNGMMDEPVEAFLATEEAHTGLGLAVAFEYVDPDVGAKVLDQVDRVVAILYKLAHKQRRA